MNVPGREFFWFRIKGKDSKVGNKNGKQLWELAGVGQRLWKIELSLTVPGCLPIILMFLWLFWLFLAIFTILGYFYHY